jgi:hypothetical protein
VRTLLRKYLDLRILFYRTRNENDLQQINADTGLRLQACGLSEPFRRPSDWGAQQALNALGTQDHQDRIHQRLLAHA